MRACRLLIAALAGLAAAGAWADRSRLADELDVAEAGDCALELAAERGKARGEPVQREAVLTLECGIGWNSEVSLARANRRSEAELERRIELELKTALVERRAGAVGWTLVAGFAAGRSADPSWRLDERFVGVEATYQIGPDWLVDARLATSRERVERRRRTLWSLGVERALSDALELRVAVGGDDRERPLAEIGLRALVVGDDGALSLTWGRGGGPPREGRVALAFTWEF